MTNLRRKLSIKLTLKIIIVTILTCYGHSFAASNDTPFRFYNNGKLGFATPNGKIIAPPIYSSAWAFNEEGMAGVKINEKWGFINDRGKVVIEPIFDSVRRFSEGLASVCKNNKCGYIDKFGNVVINFKYQEAWDFSEGNASVKINNKCGFIDPKGRFSIQPKYEYAGNFSEGLAGVSINEKYGFIDTKGNLVIDLKYNRIDEGFSEGLASIKDNIGHAYIDKRGEIIFRINHKALFAYKFVDDRAMIRLNLFEWICIDKKGNRLNEAIFLAANNFSEGLASVMVNGSLVMAEEDLDKGMTMQMNGKWGFIDNSGKFVIEPKYDEATSFIDGHACVIINGNSKLINKSGKIVWEYLQ